MVSASFPSFGTNAESHIEVLKNYYLPDFILALVAKQCDSELAQKGKTTKKLQSMNEKALNLLYEVFVERKKDESGRYIDYRFFAYVSSMYYKSEVLINETVAGTSGNHKIPVAIKKDGVYIAVAFNKSAGYPVTKKEIVRFYNTVHDIKKGQFGTQLGFATFCSSVGFKGDALVELERLDSLHQDDSDKS